jgi:hypothetical protein
VDSTDDPTHGHQQLSLFHGYYSQHMLHILVFHDARTGQIVCPFLRAGNTHTAAAAVALFRRIVIKIRERFPNIKITLRADAGFSGSAIYQLAHELNFDFCIGIAKNNRLKAFTTEEEQEVTQQYVEAEQKHQRIIGPFEYQANSWHAPQKVYAKVESTGKGLNVRYIVSNIEQQAEELYFGFYVQRGECSENRIKELKNMCSADRLSCHKFYANFLRLFFSCLTYEMMRLLKMAIAKTSCKVAKKWQVDNIRLFLLKIGACIKKRVRSITIRYSRAYPRQHLFKEVMACC